MFCNHKKKFQCIIHISSYSLCLPNSKGVICGQGLPRSHTPPEICLTEMEKGDKALIKLEVLKTVTGLQERFILY